THLFQCPSQRPRSPWLYQLRTQQGNQMTPTTDSDGASPRYVVCASCGSKAATSWTFCRSCNSSLDDAITPDEAFDEIRTEDIPDLGPTGCPKCGHEVAEVDKISTTGTGLSKHFDLQ